MKLPLFSIYDTKTLSFSQPFVLPSDAEAVRGFQSLCSDSATKFSLYPEDYELFSVGSLDDQSGWLTPTSPLKLMSALEAKAEVTRRSSEALRHSKLALAANNLTAEVTPQGQASPEAPSPTLQDCINATAPN